MRACDVLRKSTFGLQTTTTVAQYILSSRADKSSLLNTVETKLKACARPDLVSPIQRSQLTPMEHAVFAVFQTDPLCVPRVLRKKFKKNRFVLSAFLIITIRGLADLPLSSRVFVQFGRLSDTSVMG